MDKEKNKQNKKLQDELYGIDREDSLQSVHFATTENSYLKENNQEESDDE